MASTAVRVVRKILRMVVVLHERGCEGLYLDAVMSPAGLHWRYELGAMEGGRWPAFRHATVEGSIGGTRPTLPWGRVAAPADRLADAFLARYADLAGAARVAHPDYATWFREMEARSAPDGIPIFGSDLGPDHEACFLWGGPVAFRMPMPPGYRPPR